MKIARTISSIAVLVLVFSSDLSSKIKVRQLCDLVGFTLVACTSVSYDIEPRMLNPDSQIRLDNGMAFRVMGMGPIGPIFGERVAIFASKTSSAGRDLMLYALLIEDQDEVFRVMILR